MSRRNSASLFRRVFTVLAALTASSAAFAGVQDEFWACSYGLPSTLYRFDAATGNSSAIGIITNADATDIAVNSTGAIYVCESDRLYSVDPTTAQSTQIGPINTFSPIVGLAFAPNDLLYAICYNGNILRIDVNNASAVQLFVLPINFSGDLAFASNTIFYASFVGAGEDNLAKVDLGVINNYTDLGPIAAGQTVWGLDFDGGGNLTALTTGGDIYDIPNYTTSGTGVFLTSSTLFGMAGIASADTGCPALGAYCTAGFTTNFCQAAMTASGTPSASAAGGFTITMFNGEPQKQGILFYGVNNSGFTPLPWGASSSFICVKAPTQRMSVQNTGGTIGVCDGVMSQDWNAYRASNPTALGQPFSAGDDVYAQAWFRDPPSPKTTNLSNALRFTLCP
jgi:hypothetical protein